jgi:hypothetical protein
MGAWGDRQRLQKQRRAIVHVRVELVLRSAHSRGTLIRSNCSSDTGDAVRGLPRPWCFAKMSGQPVEKVCIDLAKDHVKAGDFVGFR